MRRPPGKLTLGPEPEGRWAKLKFRLQEILWGFFIYEFWHGLQEERTKYDDALNVLIVGELLGVPLMNSTVTLRLLPYILPDLKEWKKRQLTEVEVLDHPPEMH